MKNIIKKHWHETLFVTLISVYESSSYLFNLDFIPNSVKVWVGVIAFIGLVAKNYKPKK